MNPSMPTPTFSHVMLAADLEKTSEPVWAHALRVCLNTPGRLSVVHARALNNPHSWTDVPTPRELLTRWGVVREDRALRDFEALGVHVHLHALHALDPRSRIPALVAADNPDLLVLGTHRRHGLERLMYGSVGETLSRNAPHAALVVPDGVRPIVHTDTGVARLGRILVPIGGGPHQQRSVEAAMRLARSMKSPMTELILMRVGDVAPLNAITQPVGPEFTCRRVIHEDGPPVGRILQTATEWEVDAICMVTHGHDSLGDALFGSRTDRVIRESNCPVLVVPVIR